MVYPTQIDTRTNSGDEIPYFGALL